MIWRKTLRQMTSILLICAIQVSTFKSELLTIEHYHKQCFWSQRVLFCTVSVLQQQKTQSVHFVTLTLKIFLFRYPSLRQMLLPRYHSLRQMHFIFQLKFASLRTCVTFDVQNGNMNMVSLVVEHERRFIQSEFGKKTWMSKKETYVVELPTLHSSLFIALSELHRNHHCE